MIQEVSFTLCRYINQLILVKKGIMAVSKSKISKTDNHAINTGFKLKSYCILNR